jgi:hypothetical protein
MQLHIFMIKNSRNDFSGRKVGKPESTLEWHAKSSTLLNAFCLCFQTDKKVFD